MKPIIIDMEEMSDSTEVYGSRPNPAFAGMIYCLCGVLVAAIFWMCFFQIDVVVKSNGMVKSSEETATITCIPSGTVEEYYIEDGAFVEEGDLLFRIDSKELQQQKDCYTEELEDIEQILGVLNAYLEELNGTEGALDDCADNPYYEQYVNRLKMVKQNCDLTGLENEELQKQYASNIENLNNSIQAGQDDEKQLNKMLKSIKNRVNSFKEGETYYYSAVDEYLSTYHITESQYGNQISNLENSTDGDYQEQIKELELEKEKALVALEQQKVSEIEQSILSVQKNQKELEANQKLTQAQLDSLNCGKEKLSKEQIISNEKEVVFSDIQSYENKQIEYESSIESLSNSISQCEVLAQSDGYLNITQESRVGDYLTGGTVVGSIVPESGHEYKVQIYLDNHDIGRVSEGAKVKYEIFAFPSSEYGNMEGGITKISEDLKINQDTGEGYYVAEATIVLPEGIELRQGMAVEAKIVTERKRVLSILLEKLDLMR